MSSMREVIVFIAAQPGGPERLLRKHVDDGHGRCRGCAMPGTGTPRDVWPCAIHWFAEAARDAAEHRVHGRPSS